MKTYTHAGVSRLNGKMKVRYANDYYRIKILIKCGHTDIDLVELKYPGTKEDALAFLMLIDFADGNLEVRDAIEAEAIKRGVQFPELEMAV
jgi:hypothetical protein